MIDMSEPQYHRGGVVVIFALLQRDNELELLLSLRDQGGGGSNPLSPTNLFNNLHPSKGAEKRTPGNAPGCHLCCATNPPNVLKELEHCIGIGDLQEGLLCCLAEVPDCFWMADDTDGGDGKRCAVDREFRCMAGNAGRAQPNRCMPSIRVVY